MTSDPLEALDAALASVGFSSADYTTLPPARRAVLLTCALRIDERHESLESLLRSMEEYERLSPAARLDVLAAALHPEKRVAESYAEAAPECQFASVYGSEGPGPDDLFPPPLSLSLPDYLPDTARMDDDAHSYLWGGLRPELCGRIEAYLREHSLDVTAREVRLALERELGVDFYEYRRPLMNLIDATVQRLLDAGAKEPSTDEPTPVVLDRHGADLTPPPADRAELSLEELFGLPREGAEKT
ncbi:unnamed protein product [Vitrella brassicaformis CCMP3155]|uniref:Uncharacterized protein n=2 Tax=Vitrella brassicaformis TaxID=1169539 RepID=A0A0G4EVV5_VITBC|nr:unnamed protein product [Vitrella brassicaformis CCMP3155]|mmetsp:Transcript_31781/g.78803  ORF Transcript_31781/g.78803 Transcript_31781/m.78803 type:complete len:244 (+) Transcript_31781:104-835(+)|eukprot:CEM02226.1 unnamed protein product [Vitrella brassicaformis CCMP3155]